MADNTTKGKSKGAVDAVPDGHRRLRITYSPDGFRGVRDYPADVAELLVAEHRGRYVDAATPLGEDEPPAGEFRGPVGPGATLDTSGGGDTGSTTAAAPSTPTTLTASTSTST